MPLRFITKHLWPNYDKLRDFDRVLINHVEPALRITEPRARFTAMCGVNTTTVLITSQSNYFWIFQLPDGKLEDLVAEWKARFQATAVAEAASAAGGRAQLPSHRSLPGMGTPVVIDAAKRTSLLANTSKNKDLFEGLQRIKYRYQEEAANHHKSFFRTLKTDFQSLTARVEDAVHQNDFVGQYITMVEELERTYERATEHGAANELQQEILQAGGLYQVLKSAYKIGRGVGEVLSGVGLISGIKKIATGAGNFLNSAGGLIKGISDKLRGREADYRRLTSQLGLEAMLAAKKKELMGETQESIADQVTGGPERLHRGAALFKAELDRIEKGIRHSVFWMENWKIDLAQLQKEFNGADPTSYGAVLVHLFRARADDPINRDEAGIKVREVAEAEAAVVDKMQTLRAALQPQIAELRVKVRRMERMLVQDLKIIADQRAAIETRLAIAQAQTRSVTADRQYNQHQRLAHEIAQFRLTGPKLRDHTLPRIPKVSTAVLPATVRAPDPSSLALEVATHARTGTLRPATERVLAPPPVTAMSMLAQALARRREMIDPDEDDDYAMS